MKFFTLTAIGALAAAGAVNAGGLAPAPAEPLVMAPAPVMSSDWTGGYAGLSLGYGIVNEDGIDELESENDRIFGQDFDVDGDGAIGGAFAGYQYDLGSFVVGGEVDLNAANLDFDDDGIGDFVEEGFDANEVDGGANISQVHRLKLRAGYDAGAALIYGVVGAAYAQADIFDEEYSDTGYVVGAGVDYKIQPNVTVGGEVLYHSWDDFDETGVDLDATTIQARVAYQF